MLGKGSGSHHCQCKAFLDKTACVSHGIGQDYLGEGVVHGHPLSIFMVESSEGKWCGGGGCGGDNGLIQMEMGILPHLGKKG